MLLYMKCLEYLIKLEISNLQIVLSRFNTQKKINCVFNSIVTTNIQENLKKEKAE